MLNSAQSREEVTSRTPVTVPPRVYYLPDSQGRMASYYNAMELPEHYTTNHGVPRTNHFLPVGYCCLEEIVPQSKGYGGSKRRQPYISSGKVPGAQKITVMEPRAPPSSPELIALNEATPSAQKAGTPDYHLVPLVHDPLPSVVPILPATLAGHPIQQRQQPRAPAQRPCSLSTSTNGCSQQHSTHPPLSVVPASTDQPSQSVQIYPVPSLPAICRRWLIGTCRRGPACRNRHHVLHETDAELRRIKNAHLATMRFHNSSVDMRHQANEGKAINKELLDLTDEGQEEQFVEAHIEGVGRVKIPIKALGGQLNDMQLKESAKLKDITTTEPVVASPSISATDSQDEPLPDYSLSMPPTPSTAPAPTPKPPLPTVKLPPQSSRHHSPIHPAEHFRACYTPGYLPHHPGANYPPPRRHPPQDFVPRHVLDRALRQYIAGTFGGRRFGGNNGPRNVVQSARRRAVIAGMMGEGGKGDGKGDGSTDHQGVVESKQSMASSAGVGATTMAATLEKREEVELRKGGEMVGTEKDAGKEEVVARQAAVVPALLVDLA